eukprot:9473163-Pyramimonas_sp.AAC.3
MARRGVGPSREQDYSCTPNCPQHCTPRDTCGRNATWKAAHALPADPAALGKLCPPFHRVR